MTIAADIAVEALSAGLLLTRNGEHIHIESPLGRPLPEDLRVRLMERKSEVLAWLDWCEIADELLLACSRRLARSYPAGLLLNEARWRAAEEALQRAHASQDLDVFREALAVYESFAKEQFQRSRDGEQR